LEFALDLNILLRIALALGCGLVFGFERESHGRAAGLRTTALVCLSACLAMILSDAMYADSFAEHDEGSDWHPDPARLATGILTGMGFLGAGVIIRQGNVVRGVTTASVLWLATVLGLTFGSGFIALGLTGTVLAMVVLLLLPSLERKVANDWYSAATITAPLEGVTVSEISQALSELSVKVKNVELKCDYRQQVKVIRCRLKYKKGDTIALAEQAVQRLASLPGVQKVVWT
jgi:putative Mg2+ transporter-C (MgtC) family protein